MALMAIMRPEGRLKVSVAGGWHHIGTMMAYHGVGVVWAGVGW